MFLLVQIIQRLFQLFQAKTGDGVSLFWTVQDNRATGEIPADTDS